MNKLIKFDPYSATFQSLQPQVNDTYDEHIGFTETNFLIKLDNIEIIAREPSNLGFAVIETYRDTKTFNQIKKLFKEKGVIFELVEEYF